jgi:iron(III) transport system ATP-binding protein
MYNAPETLFVAEFMGSNNHIEGKIMGMSDGRASIRIGDFLLDGQARCAPEKVGQAGSAVIRLEGVHVAEGSNGGQNHVKLDLVTSMFLGHTWEHLFRGPGMTIRTHHDGPLSSGAHWLHLPADRVWIF